MKFVDPVKNPNKWLELTILKMIEERSPENEEALRSAIPNKKTIEITLIRRVL
jgi:hypothetical protein